MIGSPAGSSIGVDVTARRRRSARRAMSASSCTAPNSTQNSSPPQREITSELRSDRRRRCATSRSTVSPT
jgi:hypothetical protein